MLKIFYGNDRKSARAAIERLLGRDYEVIEAENLERGDMDTIFRGVSIFGDSRKILVKSLSENKACWSYIAQYADTPHEVIVWNTGLDKRSVVYKELAKTKTEFKEFKIVEDDKDKWIVFNTFDAALAGKTAEALRLCEKMQKEETEPYVVIGSLAAACYKKMTMNAKARAALKILAKVDLDIKTSVTEDAWLPIKVGLVKISKL